MWNSTKSIIIVKWLSSSLSLLAVVVVNELDGTKRARNVGVKKAQLEAERVEKLHHWHNNSQMRPNLLIDKSSGHKMLSQSYISTIDKASSSSAPLNRPSREAQPFYISPYPLVNAPITSIS